MKAVRIYGEKIFVSKTSQFLNQKMIKFKSRLNIVEFVVVIYMPIWKAGDYQPFHIH